MVNKRIGSVLHAGGYLTFETGQLLVKEAQLNIDFRKPEWFFEPLGPKNTFRIRHLIQEAHYLHVETGPLVCEPIQPGANSSYWIIESLNTFDTFTIRNFWRNNFYIYQDDDRVLAGEVDPKALKTHWHIEDLATNFLMVPVHLDALWLPHDQAVLGPLADFSRMPYFDGQGDVNSNTANISEEVLTPALQPPQLYLKSGLHLHWALPDALHHGLQRKDGLHFFNAPDRWLITKTTNEGKQQWIVESNYLHPPGDHEMEAAISYPNPDPSHPQPFRYLGRKLPLAGWVESDPQGTNPSYLKNLTAMGYGEPTFASFYPNCHSVFGFYDKDSAGKTIQEMKAVQYEIIGWHSAAGSDVLQDSRFQAKVDDLRAGHQATLATAPYKFEALKSAMGWIVEDAENTAFPQTTLYFARLSLAADSVPDPRDLRPKVTLAIGNAATEALSAHLGLEIGKNDKRVLEDQLEALQLMPAMEGQQQDTGPKFREARHIQGFKAIHAGISSTFKPVSGSADEANAQDKPHQAQVILPMELALQLDDLNRLHQLYNKANDRLESLREQLFSDWYKYMVAAYPPEDTRDDFPEMDEIAYFIRQHNIKEITAVQGEINTLGAALAAARKNFMLELEALQRILVEDIGNWDTFFALLGGRAVPQDENLIVVFEQIRNALPAALQLLLVPRTDQTAPLSNSIKGEFITLINTFIENDPTRLVTAAALQQLPSEAKVLFAKGKALLSIPEKRRLGRLILESALPGTMVRRPQFTVDEIPAPRYWEPAEPVVLIADSELKLTDRHGEDGRLREDGLLACSLFLQNPDMGTVSERVSHLIEAIQSRIDQLQAAANVVREADQNPQKGQIGFYTWQAQPWHPFMMEWEVELFPLKESGSHTALNRQYKADFINTHYDFPEEGVDLVQKNEEALLSRSANIYTGRSLMLDYAQPQLIERLEAYCSKHLAPLYYDAKDIPATERRNKPPLDQITAWAIANKDSLSPFNQAILAIQNHLAQNETPPIAQALSGFNAALLQHKQTLQLPIDDPLGFPDAKALAQLVRDSVGRYNRRSPQPLNDFNPLRTGALRLQHLRLVDTFGRLQTLFDDHASLTLTASNAFKKIDDRTVILPPRLVQPARLNFNWLAAAAENMAMNAHPATAPICGWLVPNYLDNSLLVYNQAGQPLGALQRMEGNIRWASAPGRAHRTLESDISNPHLYKLVGYFLSQNGNFLDDMLTAVESALENIMPASSSQHNSLALLVGRPLAVVRASLDLELKGLPATNQDWNLFRQTLLTYTRNSDNFLSVKFPLRIGEHSRLNDGLLGFWIENSHKDSEGSPYLGNKLYLPQTPDTPRTSSIDHPDLVMHRGSTVPHIQLALDMPQQTMTMLVDPRGAVHISSGILPIYSLGIPPDQYVPALQNLEMTFFSGPFLTKTDGIELPLPTEPGFAWSLLTKENGTWADTHAIDPVEQNATFSSTHMIREGWLKLEKESNNNE